MSGRRTSVAGGLLVLVVWVAVEDILVWRMTRLASKSLGKDDGRNRKGGGSNAVRLLSFPPSVSSEGSPSSSSGRRHTDPHHPSSHPRTI